MEDIGIDTGHLKTIWCSRKEPDYQSFKVTEVELDVTEMTTCANIDEALAITSLNFTLHADLFQILEKWPIDINLR